MRTKARWAFVAGFVFALVGACTTQNNTYITVAPGADAGPDSSTQPAGDDDDDNDPKPTPLPDASVGASTSSYYGACLTELAAGQVTKIFSFWATVEPTGDRISLTLEGLSLAENQPPPAVTRAGIVGGKLPPIAGAKDAVGNFLGFVPVGTTATFPGATNPISGIDVVLSNPGLRGRFAKDRFCARLVGHIDQPAAAARDLEVDKNFCIFVPITDGARTPAFTLAEYSVASCPL